jgi:L-ribulose-5-phosphate 3-epimerase
MFVSIRDDVVLHGGFSSVVEGLRDLGIDAVEVHVRRDLTVLSLVNPSQLHDLSSPEGLKALETELAQNGVRISAFLLGNDFGRDDAEEQVEWMVKTVKTAHQLGINAVRVDAIVSGWESIGVDGAIRLFAENIKQVLEATDDTDVQLGIENHGTLGNRPEFLQAVFEVVSSPRLGLTLDTGNFYWFGHPLSRVYEIMRQFAPKVKHTHVKNIAYPPEMREQQRPIGYEYGRYVCPIYEGDINHSIVVEILREAGYNGDLCIEDESLGKFAPDERRSVLQRDAEHLKALIAHLR